MEYINSLRKFVGHKPLLMIGATMLIVDEQNRLLMIRRSESGNWGYRAERWSWERQQKKLQGVSCLKKQIFKRAKWNYSVFSPVLKLYYRYPNADEVYNVSVVYLTHDVHGDLKLDSGEHIGYQYFALSSHPENVSPPIKPILNKLLQAHL